VLRAELWDGRVQHNGRFFTIDATIPAPTRTPIVLSALGPKSFRQAGEIGDGAISWMCPIDYLVDVALPELHAGAGDSGRTPPPLIAHVPIAMSDDHLMFRSTLSGRVSFYARLPAYATAFASAGHAISDDDSAAKLADELGVWGTDETIRQRLNHILASGISEVALQLLVVRDRDEELSHLLDLVDSL
jgi:alkanesulfonate monooxygenase SsuD/methylene tetrahydromethanopterin reductase-like flavin-dependent oxidoreductase (luciferase family)